MRNPTVGSRRVMLNIVENNMITISRITAIDQSVLRDLNVLLSQLSTSAKPLTMELLSEVVSNPANFLYVAKDGERIIGTAQLQLAVIMSGKDAFIQDVVVDSAYRGQGIGGKLCRALIEEAKANKCETLGLTSRPSREAANALYQKMGFQRKETNVYEMKL